jgi:hypothetical protein
VAGLNMDIGAVLKTTTAHSSAPSVRTRRESKYQSLSGFVCQITPMATLLLTWRGPGMSTGNTDSAALCCNHVVSDRVLDEFGIALRVQYFHDPILVEGNRPDR